MGALRVAHFPPIGSPQITTSIQYTFSRTCAILAQKRRQNELADARCQPQSSVASRGYWVAFHFLTLSTSALQNVDVFYVFLIL